jgi:hypothetical protein
VTDFHAFLAALLATVLVLVGVVTTGLRAKRRAHIPLVATFFAALTLTIVMAVRMGATLDFEKAGWITPVHHLMARATLVLYLLPVTTGLLTLRDARWYPRHRVCAWSLVGLTLLTVATGMWMALAAR